MTQEATNYFDGEGRNFMRECINRSVDWCVHAGLHKIVIFTGTGEGPHYAAKEILSQDKYSDLQIIAVTPPFGRAYRVNPADPNSPIIRAGINPGMRDALSALGISIVTAHLPFKDVHNGRERTSDWARVAEAYGVLGGGFALCVQALLVACDAGGVETGERVVVTAADTAFVAIASRTESFLSPTEGILVEHIICRPMRYLISKRAHHMLDHMWGPIIVQQPLSQTSATKPQPEPERDVLPAANAPIGEAPFAKRAKLASKVTRRSPPKPA